MTTTKAPTKAELQRLAVRALALAAALRALAEPCGWTAGDDGNYYTGCGRMFVAPEHHEMEWCCFCGRVPEVKP